MNHEQTIRHCQTLVEIFHAYGDGERVADLVAELLVEIADADPQGYAMWQAGPQQAQADDNDDIAKTIAQLQAAMKEVL